MASRADIGVLLVLLLPFAAVAADDAQPDSPARALTEALERRFGCDLLGRARIRVEGRGGEVLERDLDMASKSIDGRLHSLARFTAPEYLRGSALLSIERASATSSDEHFLYLRSIARVRRVTSAQRGDAFLGSDLSYEDFERRRGPEYEARVAKTIDSFGEPVDWVEARPRYESGYDRVEFAIAKSDRAILAARYYLGENAIPYKELRAPRGQFQSLGACLIPTRLEIRNAQRGSTTIVQIRDLQIAPPLDDALFSAAALESGRGIPGLTSASGGSRAGPAETDPPWRRGVWRSSSESLRSPHRSVYLPARSSAKRSARNSPARCSRIARFRRCRASIQAARSLRSIASSGCGWESRCAASTDRAASRRS